MVLEDIKPIIDELERMDPEPGQEPLTPPSVDKLVKNALSDDAATLLLAGRRKESLVDTWFRKNPRPELGERIAEAFRQRYAHLSETERSPDQIFAKLQQYAGMGGSPRRQAAALAVLFLFLRALRHLRGSGDYAMILPTKHIRPEARTARRWRRASRGA